MEAPHGRSAEGLDVACVTLCFSASLSNRAFDPDKRVKVSTFERRDGRNAFSVGLLSSPGA
jgi:hypothetical protein